MQHQQGLLIGRLDRHEPHRWACHGLTDGGCVGSIVFRPFDIAPHVARRHQTHGVTELGDFTRPMMGGSAGFHADQARGNLAKEVDDLLAPQLTDDDDLTRTIHAVHLESTPMVLTCMWTTPSGDSLFNDHPLAHSMPGAGVVHHIIRVGLAAYRRLPLYPYKQTSLPCVGMSQMCRRATLSLANYTADVCTRN